MRSWISIWIVAVALAGLTAPAATAEEDGAKGAQAASAQEEDARGGQAAMPVWVPQNRGAPPMRLGGATRGAARELPHIQALVPETAGWTLERQPVLYWDLQGRTDVPVELVLKRLDTGASVLEKALPAPSRAGVQRVALAEHGVSLEPGVPYMWLVKLVPEPGDRSHDRVTGGGIELVEASPALREQLAAPGASAPHVLAEAGIWYDALDAYNRDLAARPGDAALVAQRAALLDQVDLALN